MKDLDFSTFKDFKLRERTSLQFRTEIFNILNHPNFGIPASSLGASTFGVISSTANYLPRNIQLALKLLFDWSRPPADTPALLQTHRRGRGVGVVRLLLSSHPYSAISRSWRCTARTGCLDQRPVHQGSSANIKYSTLDQVISGERAEFPRGVALLVHPGIG